MELLIACQFSFELFDLDEARVTFFSNMMTKARSCPMSESIGVFLSKFII